MSPRLRTKRPGRHEWHGGHRWQLKTGFDFFNDACGDVSSLSADEAEHWPDAETRESMQAAWHDLKDEIMEAYADAIVRPWAWWVFEQNISFVNVPTGWADGEQDTLERLGVLTPTALAELTRQRLSTRVTKLED